MSRILLCLLLLSPILAFSQKNYTINNSDYVLYSEAEGSITLLWNTFDSEYLYFLKKGDEIVPLKNNFLNDNGVKYDEEYKQVLQEYTGLNANKVKLTKPSLIAFFDQYNSAQDPNYISSQPIKITTKLGFFGGITNYIYFVNPDNTLMPQIGAELELIDQAKLKRHSIVLQLRQIIGNSNYDFNSTQFNLNYRFKFIYCQNFNAFVNTKIANLNYINQDIEVIENNELQSIAGSGTEFEAPFALGLGAEYKIGNGYLTFLYQDIYAFNLNSPGDFPVDFALGYKFNL